jgi:serine/threonine protein kinase
MELIDGNSLLDIICREEQLPDHHWVIIIRSLLRCVFFLHQRNIAHRDIKLENIMMTNDGEVKLIDLGLASLVAGKIFEGNIVGSPGYIAPEILNGDPYGTISDIFSVGVVAYCILLGFMPFGGETEKEIL